MDSKPSWDDDEWQAKDIAINYFETKGNLNDQHQNKEHWRWDNGPLHELPEEPSLSARGCHYRCPDFCNYFDM